MTGTDRQTATTKTSARWTGRLALPLAAVFILSAFIGVHATAARGANAPAVIRIGVLVTLQGPFAVDGQDGIRGVQMAIREFGGKVAGKQIKLVIEGTDASVNTARDKVRKLIEQDGAQIEIGPLSGDEGLYGVKPYARTHPGITFVNGTSAADDTTVRAPVKNFYRFSTDGTQWMAGLGDYVYKVRGYRRMAVVAEDYSFPYSQVAGFMVPFCRDGGHVVHKSWVPIGTTDYSSVVTQIPRNVDAIYVDLGGADSIDFLKAYSQFGGKAPIVGGTVTVDQTVLSTKGTLQGRVLGVDSAGPQADNDPSAAWQSFVRAYRKAYPAALNIPSLFATDYYIAAKAVMLALRQVHGNLGGGEAAFQRALARVAFNTPTGPVRLDQNRNAIANEFINEVAKTGNGTLYNKLVRVVPNVNETLGLPRAQYLRYGEFNRNNPNCP
ncbi:MAG: ABC transporter substrate-binding protein [Chloroflexi bacterium]|nr:ABC transporter substrate-binding protein [Chloroflexota bacterium]